MIYNLKIGGIIYKIQYEDNLRNSEDRILYGDIEYSSATIRINADHAQQVQLSTILHEAMHGMLNHAGINEGHNEQHIEVIANGMLQVLVDNPELLQALPWPVPK